MWRFDGKDHHHDDGDLDHHIIDDDQHDRHSGNRDQADRPSAGYDCIAVSLAERSP